MRQQYATYKKGKDYTWLIVTLFALGATSTALLSMAHDSVVNTPTSRALEAMNSNLARDLSDGCNTANQIRVEKEDCDKYLK
jgi:hypothetical protein